MARQAKNATKSRIRSTYQHGNLPEALAEAVLQLVAEKGVRNFSVAEAARRTGVSAGAPYRHFSSRDELLAGVAAQFYGQMLAKIKDARLSSSGASEQLASMASSYVVFAITHPVAAEILFSAGLRSEDHPEILKMSDLTYREFRSAADLTGLSQARAHQLVFDVAAIAHGYVMLQANALPEFSMDADMAGRSAAEAVRLMMLGYDPDNEELRQFIEASNPVHSNAA